MRPFPALGQAPEPTPPSATSTNTHTTSASASLGNSSSSKATATPDASIALAHTEVSSGNGKLKESQQSSTPKSAGPISDSPAESRAGAAVEGAKQITSIAPSNANKSTPSTALKTAADSTAISDSARKGADLDSLYIAKHDFVAQQPRQLTFSKKAFIRVRVQKDNGWWHGDLLGGPTGPVLASGWLPASYVRAVTQGAIAVQLQRAGGSLGIAIVGGKVREHWGYFSAISVYNLRFFLEIQFYFFFFSLCTFVCTPQ